MSKPDSQHWSDYWRQGKLTSLPHGFAENYDGEFLQFWETQFSLLDNGARVLDVCSGNGSIALLAQDYSQRKILDLQVMATDAASIDTEQLAGRHPEISQHIQAIEFLPDTLLEDFRGEPASVDLVTSQFGVEYADWKTCAGIITRLLKPGGYFALVCHSADSKILQEMERQHAEYELLTGVALLNRESEEMDPATFVQQLDRDLAALYDIFQRNRRSQLLSAAGGRLEQIRKLTLQQFDTGLGEFIRFREGINASRGIAQDLLQVNRALRQSPDWHKVFSEAGLDLASSGTLHYRTGEKAGASYRFVKPGPA